MKIVIIEDEEILLRVLQEKFQRAGFEVAVAQDGEKAIEVITKHQPDVVILDLMLPKKDGFQILQELKNNTELKHIPVFVLSALSQDDNIKKAIHLGATDYLVKTQHPINEAVDIVKGHIIGKGK